MKKKRVIPVLLLRNGFLVQSISFSDYRNIGNPRQSVLRFSQWDADEIIYLDIGTDFKNNQKRQDLNSPNYFDIYELLLDVSKVSRMPVTVGGGIHTLKDIELRLTNGADKVSLNTITREDLHFIRLASREFGSQCIVASVDYCTRDNGIFVFKHNTKEITSIDFYTWILQMQELGAGEIFMNDVDRDGRKTGYNIEVIKKSSEILSIPLIACGGASSWSDMERVLLETNADAVAASNIFHFMDQSIYRSREYLYKRGLPVRQPSLSE